MFIRHQHRLFMVGQSRRFLSMANSPDSIPGSNKEAAQAVSRWQQARTFMKENAKPYAYIHFTLYGFTYVPIYGALKTWPSLVESVHSVADRIGLLGHLPSFLSGPDAAFLATMFLANKCLEPVRVGVGLGLLYQWKKRQDKEKRQAQEEKEEERKLGCQIKQ